MTAAGHRRSNCCLGIALLILLHSFLLPVVQPDLANAGGHSVFMVHHHTMMPQGVLNGAANAAAAMQQKQQQMSAAQREILGRIHQNAMAMGGMGGGSSSTAWLAGGGNAGGQQQPPAVPVNRKQEAEALARMQRIHALGTQLNKGQVLPGQLLAQQGKLFNDGKALPNQVADHAQKPPHHHHQHHQQHHHHQHNKHGGHGTQALAKAIVKAVDKKEKELLKPVLKQLHNKHSKGIRKANKAQRGFMAIVMHSIMRPSWESMPQRQQPKVLQQSKDVHNLLWTAVALARERLSVEKTNAPVCLLEFLAHMVGGAFAPFKLKKHRDDTKLVHAFLHQLRHYQVAFLSSGYHHFWTKGPHKINNFVMMEKSAKPIFLNHE